MKRFALVAVFAALLFPGAALALGCIPNDVVQTDTDITVPVKGVDVTIVYDEALTAASGAGQAAELQSILQSLMDDRYYLPDLRRQQDPDGSIDPQTNGAFHSDALGERDTARQNKQWITYRCVKVMVDWSATEGFWISWQAVR